METLEKGMLILFAAFVGESINEFLFMPFFDLLKDKVNEILRGQLVRLWSCFVGIFIAFEFQLGVFALLNAVAVEPWVDFVLTGALLGRGSNFIHELLKRFVLRNEQMEDEAKSEAFYLAAAKKNQY